MIYFDTNVLVYNTIIQDEKKTKIAEKLIKEALKNNIFLISPLIFSEYVFTLSKLKVIQECQEEILFYKTFCMGEINKEIVVESYNKCEKLNKCRNINDFIHLEIANKYCEKLVTFDNDFKNLEKFYNIKIEILKD